MYDIQHLVELRRTLESQYKDHFVEFFRKIDFENLESGRRAPIRQSSIESHKDLSNLHATTGMYLILTNFKYDENTCELEIDGLKAIYRGHSVALKRRVESHLFNDRYQNSKKPKHETVYDVCMKLNGDEGINIDQTPYDDFTWSVIHMNMRYSYEQIREAAESAFDHVFGRPIASRK